MTRYSSNQACRLVWACRMKVALLELCKFRMALAHDCPNNSRYVNPSATTINAAIGMNKDNWGVEFFIDNLTNEEAPVVQVAGKFTPELSVQRPLTAGLRFSFDYE